jgi:hypothetical protein
MKIKSTLFVNEISPFFGFSGGEVKVYGVMDDDSQEHLFNFYSDELRFSQKELVGLTSQEARELKVKKDIEYLRS